VACALLVTAIAAVAFGVAPALMTTRMRLFDALREAGRRGRTTIRQASRRALVVCELGLSVVLVAGSGLMIRSLAHQLGADLGFAAPHGLTFEVSLPPSAYPEAPGVSFRDHPRAVAFIRDALARLRAIPGVTAAAIGKPLPMRGAEETTVFVPEGSVVGSDLTKPTPTIDYTMASPGMLNALGNHLLTGRDFDDGDRIDAPPVVILNESASRWLWPGQDAIVNGWGSGIRACRQRG
jgi:hypothetical protein